MTVKMGMTPPHPGGFIKRSVLPDELSVTAAAEVLGVGRPALSSLLNEKAALSPEMALRIEKAFGVRMDTLLRMQARHDAFQMRRREREISVGRYVAA
jgi:antitoxin HigA-1